MNTLKENTMVIKALEVFRHNTGLEADIQYGIGPADGMLRIGYQNRELFFAVETKARVNKTDIGILAQQAARQPERTIIITQYINPKIAEKMNRMDLPFIDTAGNVYVKDLPLYIYIKGNKPAEKLYQTPLIRAFKAKGLQVIFALLCNPGLEKYPLKEIAEITGTALGTVQIVLMDLKKEGYLVDMGRQGRKLINKGNLLNRWVIEYPGQLRPKQLIGRFQAPGEEWWKDVEIKQYDAYWGGEIAAQITAKYLKPEITTIYTNQHPEALVFKNRLKKDPNGDVEILKTFWNIDKKKVLKNIVHPVLIYADLMATGDTRNIEAAEIVYERDIIQLIR